MKALDVVLISMIILLCNVLYSKQGDNMEKYVLKSISIAGENYDAEVNNKTGAIHRLYGLKGMKNATEQNVRSLSKEFVNQHKELFKVSTDNLELVDCHKSKTKNRWYVNYRQMYKGVPVYRSSLGYTVHEDGSVPIMGSNVYTNISIDINPSITKEAALGKAKQELIALAQKEDVNMPQDGIEIRTQPELMIYPIEKEVKYEYKLVYRIEIESAKPTGRFSQAYFIDAKSGEVVDQYSNIRYSMGGQVKIEYWPRGKGEATQIYTGWPNGTVSVAAMIPYNVYKTTTDANGNYYINGRRGVINFINANTGVGPYNDFIKIGTNQLTSPQVHGDLPRNEFSWNWKADMAMNVFVHCNKIHDYIKTFTNVMNYQVPVNLLSDKSKNGEFNGVSISFGTSDGTQWASYSEIIYHEYAHCVIYNIYGGWIHQLFDGAQAAAMDEGLADYFACDMNNDPVFGKDIYGCIKRNLDNTLSWNDNVAGDCINGQIIGGACWDLRKYLYKENADRLIFEALEMYPPPGTFAQFAKNVGIADDNDGNLRNSIPDWNWINRAFKTKHGIDFDIPYPYQYGKIAEEGELDGESSSTPGEYKLSQNYPNPFNPSTTISFSVPEPSDVKIAVYNVLGQEVAALTNDQYNAGIHTVQFNASRNLSSGIYIVKAKMSPITNSGTSHTLTNKIVLVK